VQLATVGYGVNPLSLCPDQIVRHPPKFDLTDVGPDGILAYTSPDRGYGA